MIQKTSFELVLTPQEAEQYHRTIHRAISLMLDLPLPQRIEEEFERTHVRADLMRLAAKLDAAVLPPVPPPVREKPFDPFTAEVPPDPFTSEGNGSAQDVLLGRLVSVCALLLGHLARYPSRPDEAAVLQRTKHALLADWKEYEELSRG